jgi:hypothetical protein
MAVLTFPAIVPNSISFGIKYSTQINVSPLSGSVQTVEIPGARWTCSMSFSDMEPEEGRVLAAFLAQLRGSSGRFKLYDFSHKNPRGSNLAIGNIVIDVRQQATSDTGTTSSATAGPPGTMTETGKTFITSGNIATGDYLYIVTNDEYYQIASFTEDTITIVGSWTTQPVATNTYEIYPAFANSITTSGWNATETNVLLPGDYIEIEGNELKIVTSSVSSDGAGDAVISFEPPVRIQPNEASIVKRASCEAIMLLDNDESQWITDNAGLLSDITITCIEGFS